MSMMRVSATTNPALASACWIVSHTSFEEFENSTVIHRPGLSTRWNSAKHRSISSPYSESVRTNRAALAHDRLLGGVRPNAVPGLDEDREVRVRDVRPERRVDEDVVDGCVRKLERGGGARRDRDRAKSGR